MKSRDLRFRLGLFVIGAIALAIVGIVLLGKRSLFRETIPGETYFDQSVSGLSIGAPVKHRGVNVGRVTRIGFVTSKYKPSTEVVTNGARKYNLSNLILVEMEIDREAVRPLDTDSDDPKIAVNRMVKDGLRMRYVASLLGGGGYIDADFVRDPERSPALPISWTPDVLYVPSRPGSGAQIMETLDSIAGDIQRAQPDQLLRNVNNLVVDARKFINMIDAEKFQTQGVGLLTDLRETTARIQKILDDPSIASALANASAATGNIRTLTEPEKSELARLLLHARQAAAQASDILSDPSLKRTLSNMGPASTDVRRTLARLSELFASQQQNLSELIRALTSSAQNIEAITSDAKENPSRILFGEPPPKKDLRSGEEKKTR